MLFLQPHHITDLYCFVDDMLPKEEKPLGGRPSVLSDSELVTILLWNALVAKQQLMKDIHVWIQVEHEKDFPRIPSYNAFLDHAHRLLPVFLQLLNGLLCTKESLRFMDSTMIEVCTLARADFHRVAKSVARFGKNHQGWHYGFKLHASVDAKGRLCQILFSPANMHDAQGSTYLVNGHTRVAVGDQGYNARVMKTILFHKYGVIILTPPHFKQRRQLMTPFQHRLLRFRPKIESVFDYLKQHLHLQSSFPRSIRGYFVHYARVLLSYQIMALGRAG